MPDADKPRVTARMLNGLDAYLAKSGLALPELARQTGISAVALGDPDAFVDFSAVLNLFELAARATEDDVFGLHFAEAHPLGPIGLFHFIMMNAPTISDALAARTRYTRLVTNAYKTTFSTDEWHGTYTWEFPADLGPRTQFTNYVVMLLVERVRYMMARNAWMPTRVEFDHRAPQRLDDVKRCLGRNVSFNCRKTLLVIDSASLGSRIQHADTALRNELQSIADKLLTVAAAESDLERQVIQQILTALPSGDASMKEIASRLEMSPTTLRTRLRTKGTTFSGLIDVTRRNLAERLLVETDLPLSEIAFAVGFSELSAFSRASRLWFEMPASQFRKTTRRRH